MGIKRKFSKQQVLKQVAVETSSELKELVLFPNPYLQLRTRLLLILTVSVLSLHRKKLRTNVILHITYREAL